MKKFFALLLAVLMLALPVTAYAETVDCCDVQVSLFEQPVLGAQFLAVEGSDTLYLSGDLTGDKLIAISADEVNDLVARVVQMLADAGVIPQEVADKIVAGCNSLEGKTPAEVMTTTMSMEDIEPVVTAVMELIQNSGFAMNPAEANEDGVAYYVSGTIYPADLEKVIDAINTLAAKGGASVEADLSALDGSISVEIALDENKFPMFAWIDCGILEGDGTSTFYELYAGIDEDGLYMDLSCAASADAEEWTPIASLLAGPDEEGFSAQLDLGDPDDEHMSVFLVFDFPVETEDGTETSGFVSLDIFDAEGNDTELGSINFISIKGADDVTDVCIWVEAEGEEVFALDLVDTPSCEADLSSAVDPVQLDDDAFMTFCGEVINSFLDWAESVGLIESGEAAA